MQALDYLKATGVALVTLIITLALSFPMVAFYAYVIEPGHDQSFYTEAAQWIAPWSSHIFGPLTLFAFNYSMAKRRPERNAVLFVLVTIAMYIFIDFGMLFFMHVELSTFLTLSVGLSMAAKVMGALLGAHIGARARTE